MARPKAAVPSMRYHLSGQAVVSIAGRDFYLGKHNSPEALARYAVLIADYQRGEFSLPAGYSIADVDAKAGALVSPVVLPAVKQADEPLTVRHIMQAYSDHAEEYYHDDPCMRGKIKKLCDELSKHYGKLPANSFGPVILSEQRERWVKRDLSREYVNSLTNLVFRVFKWALSRELIEATVIVKLKTLEPLRQGKTKARETAARLPVPLEHVRKTAKFLSPVLKAMLRIHVACGMRPTELLTMRPCDIDRSGPEWIYRPLTHKCMNKGKTRAIPILGDAKEALIDYMNREPQSYCFSPKECVAWLKAQKRANRKTKVQPSQQNKPRKANPLRQPGERYDKDSYRRAIQRAAKEAGVPIWHPYQIRHLNGTVVREALGIESVEALLGHSTSQMAKHYAKLQETQAVKAARSAPQLGGDV